jgi:predicted nucleic acid-binding protein
MENDMVFIDTGPFLAQRLSRDPYRKDSLFLWKRLEKSSERFATSNFILDELINEPITRRSTGH